MPITYIMHVIYEDVSHSREFIDRDEAIRTAKEKYEEGALSARVYHYDGPNCIDNCVDDLWLENDETENPLVKDGGQFGMGA